MKEQKLTNRKKQSIQTKQMIYEAALKLMKKKDFHDVTIEEISKSAGVSIGSFYYHFKSKEEICLKMFEQIDKKLFHNFIVGGQTKPTVQLLLEFFTQLASIINEFGLNIMKFNLITNETAFYRKDWHLNIALLQLIKRGQTNEELSLDMTEEETAEYLLMTFKGIILDWCISNGEYSIEGKTAKLMKRSILSLQIPS